ncbi:E3 ubiquitin-protein ligase TRIM71-like [Branchiostoma floridae]|uniref:E3 ubiquitin-protein ligase TRIM71-like n=1 Tax=Branchiostoma floridae TaxID=7739 RepID=A0A9J7MEB1_BRAFL|nr:E3 ubiquitin-protein ligase TRIM71-like [Branchiostoma floridae]
MPVLSIGRKGRLEGDLFYPTDVAVDMDGNIAVVEDENRRVQIFDAKTGQSLRSFPVDGGSPYGIDVDPIGQFILTFPNISTTGNQTIQVYSQNGKRTKTLKPYCQLQDPRGIAVLQDGRMVVANSKQKSCLLLQPDGSLIREIGKGQLQRPWFIAVDESRDLFFVTDGWAHKVLVFDLEGKLKFRFGKQGKGEGELYCPSGIAVDPAGNIIVVSPENGRLQVFGPDGTYLRTVATMEGGFPQGIALTPDNHIAVTCSYGHCVDFYRYMAAKHFTTGAMGGQSVEGSPFDIRKQSNDTPVLTIGREGRLGGQLSCPADVAVDIDGNIAVLEAGNKRVQIFDAKTGQSLRGFPVDGGHPWAIGMDSNGQFIVTFSCKFGNDRAVRVYSREGKLTKTLKPESLRDPTGVAVLQDGRMVVVDSEQKFCLLLQPDGRLIRDIGKGQLQYPRFLAVDESRDLFFVTDCRAHKVFVFDLEGKLKFSFGKEGLIEGELCYPTGITEDPAGNIIVVNSSRGRLQVFEPDGTYLRTVAWVRGRFPRGIALTPDGRIAVTCYNGHCVELYRYK